MRFDIPTQGEIDLPLSDPCEDVNAPGQSSERYGRCKVGTMLTYMLRTLLVS